jgi:hypothetical protein
MRHHNLLFIAALSLTFVAGQGFCADEVRDEEKGTYLGALFSARKSGVVITHVLANSPAARANLRRNDIIVEYDKMPVRDADHLARLIQADKPARKVLLVILRNDKRQNVDVTLALGPALRLDNDDPEPPRPTALTIRATPLDSGAVRLTIEYPVGTGKKVVTCEGAAKELNETLQKLPERERQLVRVALERLKALEAPEQKKK